MFLLWFHVFSLQTTGQTLDSSAPTIRSKNLSPSLLYRSRCFKLIPMWVTFCSSSELISTHTAETSEYHRICVMTWRTCSTLMPRFSLIRESMMWWSHRTIWYTSECVSGSVMRDGWPGRARSPCCSYSLWTSCTSETLLYTETVVAILMLRLRMNVHWSCTVLTQKLDDAALCMPG